MFDVEGKVCVVTGAGRGLGYAIAMIYAEHGGKVFGAARSVDELEKLEKDIKGIGGEVSVLRTDVTKRSEVDALAAAAVEKYGTIDVWVNNAGGFVDGSTCDWIDVDPDAMEEMWRLNVSSYVFGSQAAARVMRDGGKGGSLIFLGSLDAHNACPGGEGCYGAAKAAVTHIMQTMAVELGRYGIRVNAIAPGLVQTPLVEPFLGTPEIIEDRARYYPLGRIGQPSDVANAALYMASDASSYVSGATLLVSGGAVFNSDPIRYLQALGKS
ncbi:SDR family NAD(P)-dependent oxidoreductase [Streptomyces sp. NBC_01794]|uniref:SDR family NAD(P)-dependent oxidoreductase n=1 Tax=Streptomyces sp. NBC_01794 TaxID=2975942 RepID=UPI0030877B27|nr:glucose 1-dehydrogenase [Streptomyces sp. NBC_01794]